MASDLVRPVAGAGEAGREATQGRVFPCERCGADLTFHIGTQRLRCAHCGHEKALGVDPGAPERAVREHDLREALGRLAAGHGGETAGAREVACGACGAHAAFDGTLTASRCAYCAAPLSRADVHEARGRIAVDGLLTFGVERRVAAENLAAWVRSRWFAPSAWRRAGVAGRFDQVYLPFFTFDAMTTAFYEGQRGDHYYVTVKSGDEESRERRTSWSSASGRVQRFFDDLLVPACAGLPPALLRPLEPWPLARCQPFSRDALAGALAHTYDVELEDAFAAARARMEEALHDDAKADIGGDEQRVDELRVSYEALRFKHLLLPVWLLAYRYRDRSFRVVVNACTGEVHGERPWSPYKIALAVVVALAVATGVAWLGRG